ncbi:MAG: hypothetical protein SH850_30765 [Planctomycetaceae bacterium]|nr:hypothetical protein [Planctomycetaceae bacterium]
MIPKGSRYFVGIAVLQVALFSAGVAEGQLSIERPLVDANPQVSTWGSLQTAVPNAAVDGDWLLTGWGPSIVETPGLALVQLSTGKTMWTEPAEPDDWLTGWLMDDRVHMSRHLNNHEAIEYQIRDPATGAVEHSETIDTTNLQHLTTVFIAGHNEVFDRRTGERRGSLPADVSDRSWFRESAGRLYGNSVSDSPTKQGELLEIDLANLEITRRFNFSEWFPARRLQPIVLSNPRHLIFSSDPQTGLPSRLLTAVDLEPRQIAWQREVAPHAPLLFVDDLAADPELPPELTVRPLLIEWSTGKQRLGNWPQHSHADLTQWLSHNHSGVDGLRKVGTGFVTQISGDEGIRQLVGLNSLGLPIWRRDLTAQILMVHDPVPVSLRFARVWMSDQTAAIAGAYQIELVDLRTGDITHTVTPESVGLVRKPMRPEDTAAPQPAAKTSPVATPPPGWKLPDNVTIPAAVLILLVGYLVVRRVALRPGGNPPGTL